VDIVKAPLALAIPGLVACERLQMHNAARKFGLYTESEGYEDWGSERSLVIGRCRESVGRLARGGNDSEEGVAVGKEEAGKEEGKKMSSKMKRRMKGKMKWVGGGGEGGERKGEGEGGRRRRTGRYAAAGSVATPQGVRQQEQARYATGMYRIVCAALKDSSDTEP